MPTPCYISIEGSIQGNITAGAFTPESVGNIFVEGQRKHRPFVFTVFLNKAIPLLYLMH